MPADAPRRGRRRSGSRFVWIACLILVIVAAAVVVWGVVTRVVASRDLHDATEKQAVPTVSVIEAPRGPNSQEIILPGNVQAFFEAPIYARTSGYVKAWYTDIGTRVKANQLLAEIDTPEVDDQLRQAQADLLTAEANDRLAQSTARRWTSLLATDSVSKQETDEKVGDAEAKAALVASSRANVARLQQQEAFKRVLAPFDGVVTARRTDIGALINAGSGQGPELFAVAKTDKLRIYIRVPQPYAPSISIGMSGKLFFAEYPRLSFPATVVRTADSIDPVSRTLLTELQTDNSKGELYPGGYTQVHLTLASNTEAVRLPVASLLFRADGLQVATIVDDNKTKLKHVTIGRDFGTEVEIVEGIDPGERVIINPPDSLLGGETVAVEKAQAKKGPAQ
jgi:RND family efflux transporter MFP subunit